MMRIFRKSNLDTSRRACAARRAAYTLVEALVASALLGLLLTMLQQLHARAQRARESVARNGEALRSAMIATEFLRLDLGRTLLHGGDTGCVVEKDGRALRFTFARSPRAELDRFDPEWVIYRSEPVTGRSGIYNLIRETAGEARPLKQCFLREFTAQYIPVGEISPHRAYVEITLVGTDIDSGASACATSELIPVHVPRFPEAYTLLTRRDAR